MLVTKLWSLMVGQNRISSTAPRRNVSGPMFVLCMPIRNSSKSVEVQVLLVFTITSGIWVPFKYICNSEKRQSNNDIQMGVSPLRNLEEKNPEKSKMATIAICSFIKNDIVRKHWEAHVQVQVFISSAVPIGSGAFQMPTRPSSSSASASTLRRGRANLRNASVTFSLFWHEASLG